MDDWPALLALFDYSDILFTPPLTSLINPHPHFAFAKGSPTIVTLNLQKHHTPFKKYARQVFTKPSCSLCLSFENFAV